jgi:aminoglycoside phosphotransferase (APT) family kinase protein
MTSVNSSRIQVDEKQLRAVLDRAGIDPAELAGWSELDAATFNTAYRIRLSSGQGLVLKVAPRPDAPTLAYERGIMRTETEFYGATAGVLPVPEVVYADFSRDLLASDLLLMTELPGTTWLDQHTDIDDATRTRLRTELGALTSALHGIHGTVFGYPQRALFATWRAAFTSMMGDLLADAARYATPLPQPVDRIRNLVTAHNTVLDEVTTPVLVHFDLWPGNILLDGGRITGLVDGERAFWGDPLAEFISLSPLRSIEDDSAFLAGYGAVVFGGAARTRLALYRTYLFLIVLVEGGPRGYHGQERDETVQLVTEHLDAALAKLDS